MKPVYLFITFFLFISCGNVKYVGQSYEPTSAIDVYVSTSAIKRSYDVVGIGFVNSVLNKMPEAMQSKAVAKARRVGADALLIEYYSRELDNASVTTTQIQIDTVGRFPQGSIVTQKQPVTQSGFTIRFLKYN